MPYLHGIATSYEDLISQLIEWSTDSAIHGTGAWELVRNEPWPRGTILKVQGLQAGEHYYIGLMPQTFTSTTYYSWLATYENIARYFVWNKNALNLYGQSFSLSTSQKSVTVGNTTYYFNADSGIFADQAKAMFLGVFKQYEQGLDWHEQPGGMVFGDMGLKQVKYTALTQGNSFSSTGYWTPPLYPGVGYPALGMDYDDPIDGYFDFWLVKDNTRIIIVTNNRGYWDAAQIGMLIPYQGRMQNPFPAVVVGGTSGAFVAGNDEVVNTDTVAVHTGVVFSYSYKNWSLTRGIPNFSAVPADSASCVSQVMYCQPDGAWQAFANWSQGMKTYRMPNSNYHMFPFAEPVRCSKVNHYIRPNCSSLEATTHPYDLDKTKIKYQIEPLELFEADGLTTNMIGQLWRMYWPSNKVSQYGEVYIDNKLHLMLPNCWEDRRWYLYDHLDDIWTASDLINLESKISKMSKQMNCLIRLED